jgi:hypothetical protein
MTVEENFRLLAAIREFVCHVWQILILDAHSPLCSPGGI